MLFSSYSFIFYFLPITLIGYYLLNRLSSKLQGNHNRNPLGKTWLLLMSLFFYSYFHINYLFLIVASILLNFLFGKLMQKHKHSVILALGIVLNLGLLGYFKYWDFFMETLNQVFSTNWSYINVLLPLGISFFTFQQISYLVDCFREKNPDYQLLDYALFVSFFPQLIAGPIVTHKEIIPQFQDLNKQHFHAENFSKGLIAFSIGLAKKVLLADVFGQAVDYGFAIHTTLNSGEIFLIMLSYTMQIYFDFSGYCDMAGGIAKMFNIYLPMNFSSPYRAVSIREFWDRWHITLTRFLTNYVYIPLGGNRKGLIRTCLHILIVFVISGLWHGAQWTFVFWGFLHGVFMVVERLVAAARDKRKQKNAPQKATRLIKKVLAWGITFLFVNITWLYFRADSIMIANQMLHRAFSFTAFEIRGELFLIYAGELLRFVLERIDVITPLLYLIPMIFMLVLSMFLILCCKNTSQIVQNVKPTYRTALATIFLLLAAIVSLGGESAFLYFNF